MGVNGILDEVLLKITVIDPRARGFYRGRSSCDTPLSAPSRLASAHCVIETTCRVGVLEESALVKPAGVLRYIRCGGLTDPTYERRIGPGICATPHQLRE